MKIINVVGARPNFMKMAPLVAEMKKHAEITPLLVHTEQHYDEKMSKLFFDDLKMPAPDIFLGVGPGTHAQQTARIMTAFEAVLLEHKPDLVVVVGDVNSTLACAITSAKLNIPVAHIEAGLRSFDRTMPEEINRVVTDAISDYLFITEKSAQINLRNEGIPAEKIFFVGNLMIDTLLANRTRAESSGILEQLGLKSERYALLTLHRPANVDVPQTMGGILEAIGTIQERLPVIYPVHPRAKKTLSDAALTTRFPFLCPPPKGGAGMFRMIDPLGYLDFLKLTAHARLVLTDSGGIQEETTVLGVACVTIRENTERPVTIEQGTNVLAGTTPGRIIEETMKIIQGGVKTGCIPEKWDGRAAQRIVEILLRKTRTTER